MAKNRWYSARLSSIIVTEFTKIMVYKTFTGIDKLWFCSALEDFGQFLSTYIIFQDISYVWMADNNVFLTICGYHDFC